MFSLPKLLLEATASLPVASRVASERHGEFTRALTIEDVLSISPPPAASLEGAAAIAHLAHSNRSLCFLKMGRHADALRAAEQATLILRSQHKEIA
jgi:hypothetical protein